MENAILDTLFILFIILGSGLCGWVLRGMRENPDADGGLGRTLFGGKDRQGH